MVRTGALIRRSYTLEVIFPLHIALKLTAGLLQILQGLVA